MLNQLTSEDLTDDLLGFFSMIVSYAKGAGSNAPGESSKMIIPIMPRTDFVTIYGQISSKLADQLHCDTLFNIEQILAMYKGDGTDTLDDAYNLKDNELQGMRSDRVTVSSSYRSY